MNHKQPNDGDLIEFLRGTYNHWGVYVGNGYVVHLTKLGGGISGSLSSSSNSSSSSLGSTARDFAEMFNLGLVKKEELTEVAGEDPWIIENSLDEKLEPYKPEQIVKRALEKVGKRHKYHLVKYNCEHFAKELRYGCATSEQVDEAKKGPINALVDVNVKIARRMVHKRFNWL